MTQNQILSTLPAFHSGRRGRTNKLRIQVLRESDRRTKNEATLDTKKIGSDFPSLKFTQDFRCLEGWEVKGVAWEGIRVSDLLIRTGFLPNPSTKWVLFSSGDYTWQMSLKNALRGTTILATRMNGRKLTPLHGGPLRLVFKGQQCFGSVKGVERVVLLEKRAAPTAERIATSRLVKHDASAHRSPGKGGIRKDSSVYFPRAARFACRSSRLRSKSALR